MKDDNNRVIDFSKNGECSRCCHCCGPLLPLKLKEAQKMKELYKNNEYVRSVVDYNCTINEDGDGPMIRLCCPFADIENHKCSIYEDRPEICRVFRCHNHNSNDVKACEQKAHYNHINYYKNKDKGDKPKNFMTVFKLLGKGLMHNLYIFYHMRAEISFAYKMSVEKNNDKILLKTLQDIDEFMHFDQSTYNKALNLYNQCYDKSMERD